MLSPVARAQLDVAIGQALVCLSRVQGPKRAEDEARKLTEALAVVIEAVPSGGDAET
ncbi:MAG: hypothetical protein WCA14_12460 [Steroidobacteraceae bacterium]